MCIPSNRYHFLLILYVFITIFVQGGLATWFSNLWIRQASAAGPLVDFQVYQPILTPSGTSDQYGCVYTKELMSHVFANSYGAPFVGNYTPPPCTFNRVTMNFTVTSKGRQFDRLGLMYLGDIEVFRTSTAEPTTNGIVWTYIKEMEQYNALWATDQKIIFDLGNLVNKLYTGAFSTMLTATFFTVPDSHAIADTILPISAKQSASNIGSAFTLPSQNASVSYTLPQNVERAVISLSACGQIAEEFWYSNVFSSDVNTFNSTVGILYGYGPFREVQLLIDGQLAGVSYPFPIIFTGGIEPGFWRPIVGIDAFDLRQHEVDVSPWLPLLCDGATHTFEIRVAGLDDDGAGHATLSETVGSYWVVTGTIFLFLGEDGSVTTGSEPSVDTPAPQIQISSHITTNFTGANQTLTYNTAVTRDISISSTVKTSNGSRLASWTQQLSYSNFNSLTAQGITQSTVQNTTGADISTSGYSNTYSYPLSLISTYFPDGDISAYISHGLTYNVFGPSVFPSGIRTFDITSARTFTPSGFRIPQTLSIPSTLPALSGALLSTTQTSSQGSNSFDVTTTQDFDFKGAELSDPSVTYELYYRNVTAVDWEVTEDTETLAGQTFAPPIVEAGGITVQNDLEGFSVRGLLGRGPGGTKPVG